MSEVAVRRAVGIGWFLCAHVLVKPGDARLIDFSGSYPASIPDVPERPPALQANPEAKREGTLDAEQLLDRGGGTDVRARILAGVVAGLALVLGVTPTVAQAADDYLVTSNPAPRDEVDNPPGWVTLVFRTEASAKLAKIVVQNGAGLDVTTGDIIVEGTNVTVQLISNLPRDTFTVTYRTSDAKGEPRGGAFQFSYGPGTWTDVNDTWIGASAEPTVIASPPSAAPEPEEPPTADPATPTQEPATTGPATTGPTTEPGPPSGGGDPNAVWWFVGGGVLLAAAGGGYALARRRGTNRSS